MQASEWLEALDERRIRESPSLSRLYGVHVKQDTAERATGKHYPRPDHTCIDCKKPIEGRALRCDACKLEHKRVGDRIRHERYRASSDNRCQICGTPIKRGSTWCRKCFNTGRRNVD